MLSGISLTPARGFDSDDEFLISLGADLDELAARTPYQDRGPLPADHHPAMYGTHGDWLYVLENWGRVTWYTGYTCGVKSMRPYPDEEIICITLNEFSPPQMIVHAPATGTPTAPSSPPTPDRDPPSTPRSRRPGLSWGHGPRTTQTSPRTKTGW
ncbi:hypothetical protein [Streptomyces sp. NPDC059262]|uniref:hypothetical protein n=1 Tax=Streptomyces sp. NPDC059262 TaxID=3346797 RepID=UPI0036CE25BA